VRLKGNRVMVTGADGFIGSHLTEALVRLGARVSAFCYYNSFDSHGWLDTVPSAVGREIDFLMGDIRDPNGVRNAVTGQDVVFHLAALVGIPFSYHSPDSYIDTNVKGTLNILQASRDLDVQRLVVTSTSEVYGTARYVPMDERHTLQGQSPYSASKIGADKIAESFHRSFGLPVVTVRPFNTYGPRQSARAVIPTIIVQLLSGAKELYLGSVHPTRDFNYVDDTVSGFIALAQCDQAVGREVNVGSGLETSIADLVAVLLRITESKARLVQSDDRRRPEASEVDRLLCDNALVSSLTRWTPTVSLEDGLGMTVEWFRGFSGRDGYSLGYVI
jgi:NAD dependent epimerase/dehydratase